MTQTASVYGVRQTLADLAAIDPALKRELQKSMRDATQPLVAAVGSSLPAAAPLSGMARGRYSWNSNSRKANAKTGGRKRADGTFPLVAVLVKDAAAQVADMAQTGSLGQNLSARFGRASRFVWPAAQHAMPAVERACIDAIEQASQQLNRKLIVKPRTGA